MEPKLIYCHRETINKHESNIKKLLDLNFGKDWRLFISVYYSSQWQTHAAHYKNPTYLERKRFPNPNHGAVARKIYWSKFRDICREYLVNGFESAEKKILDNQFRFKWALKKGDPQEPIISDELFNEANSPKPTPEPTPVVQEDKVIQEEDSKTVGETTEQKEETDPYYYADQINKTDERFNELQDKELAGELLDTEIEELKELRKNRNKWQNRFDLYSRFVNPSS